MYHIGSGLVPQPRKKPWHAGVFSSALLSQFRAKDAVEAGRGERSGLIARKRGIMNIEEWRSRLLRKLLSGTLGIRVSLWCQWTLNATREARYRIQLKTLESWALHNQTAKRLVVLAPRTREKGQCDFCCKFANVFLYAANPECVALRFVSGRVWFSSHDWRQIWWSLVKFSF